ncbi:hypothetical protein GOB93_09045 [Acetobacter musti]|uniref:Transposase n=1 Tax=Acetobacter musti TaxID=864732 RepID=A0ABX0JSA3_9PROT|nr:hypothetical protein [Acetobacter musti]NHN84787.1 hypothetical protein [Acetobacter musti]
MKKYDGRIAAKRPENAGSYDFTRHRGSKVCALPLLTLNARHILFRGLRPVRVVN